jgi:hypothetical protein
MDASSFQVGQLQDNSLSAEHDVLFCDYPGCVLLKEECDTLLADISKVYNFAGLVALQRQLQNRKYGTDFELALLVGEGISPHLELLERHAALVKKVTERCEDLVSVGDYAVLKTLAYKLAALKQVAEVKKPSIGLRVIEGLIGNPIAVPMLLAIALCALTLQD